VFDSSSSVLTVQIINRVAFESSGLFVFLYCFLEICVGNTKSLTNGRPRVWSGQFNLPIAEKK